jgi:hypothetical protein
LVGWALVIKGSIRFCAPTIGLRMMARVSVGAVVGVPGGRSHARCLRRPAWLWGLYPLTSNRPTIPAVDLIVAASRTDFQARHRPR